MAVEGMDELLGSLNNAIKRIEGRTLAGLEAAALKILGDAQQLTPVLTGNLKSDVAIMVESENPPAVSINFNASYAVFVHENLEIKHRNGQAKFLETALKNDASAILGIITSYAK